MCRLLGTIPSLLVPVMAGLLVGCSGSAPPQPAAKKTPDGAAYRLATEPAMARSVSELRADAKDGEEVTLIGRIGGDAKPWVDGQAAFLVVDSALLPCKDEEGCPTPWDYCCATDLVVNKAMVKILDSNGKVVNVDAKKLLDVKELQTVVVQGKAKRDDTGNLTILADGVFVRN